MARYEELKDKRVIVTGAASGIGLATAQRFVKEGSKVVIFDNRQDALDEALKENPGLIGGALVDVSVEQDVKNGFLKSDELIGGVDVLISNAGISIRKDFLGISYEQWKKVLDINLGGMFLCAKEAVSRMEKQKSGVVLFTASTNGVTGRLHELYTDYNASKAGVILMAKTIAIEYAPWLRANAVCPGYVLTPMQKAEYTEEMFARVNEGIPLKRHALPEEVGALYAFLASDEAKYITGQAIAIDGGELA